jgi:hypothetical protein
MGVPVRRAGEEKPLVSQKNVLSRRGFLVRASTVLTGFLLLSLKPAWATSGGRLVCRGCKAEIKPEAAGEITCCPNCGREWWTGGFALKDSIKHRFPVHDAQPAESQWDYAQVPFPNFQFLAKSDKPVLSLKQITFSGRGAA